MVSTLVSEVEELVRRVGTHPVWGYEHCLRVDAVARELARREGLDYDPEIPRLSSLLHDVGLYKAYNLREAQDHAERSAVVARRILLERDFPERAARVVAEVVRHHQPGSRAAPFVESALVNDAVALDYLGAIGVSRVLAMVGLEKDVPDIKAAVSHAEGLRRSIPETLNFDSGRVLAAARAREMDDFFGALRRSTEDLQLI